MAEAFLPEHPAILGYEVVRRMGRNGAIIYLARRTSSDEEVVLRVYNRGELRPVDTQEALLAQLNEQFVGFEQEARCQGEPLLLKQRALGPSIQLPRQPVPRFLLRQHVAQSTQPERRFVRT